MTAHPANKLHTLSFRSILVIVFSCFPPVLSLPPRLSVYTLWHLDRQQQLSLVSILILAVYLFFFLSVSYHHRSKLHNHCDRPVLSSVSYPTFLLVCPPSAHAALYKYILFLQWYCYMRSKLSSIDIAHIYDFHGIYIVLTLCRRYDTSSYHSTVISHHRITFTPYICHRWPVSSTLYTHTRSMYYVLCIMYYLQHSLADSPA